MAGLGRKIFNAGDILTAAQVQGFLQDQTIMVFANQAARDVAIPVPSKGMFVFLNDVDTLFLYDGNAFVEFSGGGGEGEFQAFLLMGA